MFSKLVGKEGSAVYGWKYMSGIFATPGGVLQGGGG